MIRYTIAGILIAAGAVAAQVGDKNVEKGDYYFKAGYYYKASEHYRLAVQQNPTDADKILRFGHSLFAIGNYSYASYALRKGLSRVDPSKRFRPELASLFPAERDFVQVLRDLKVYVTYRPRDPAGLTVLSYVLYTIPGEEERCQELLGYLRRHDKDDPYVAFMLHQMGRKDAPVAEAPAPTLDPLPPVEVPPLPKQPEPPPPAPKKKVELTKVLPQPERVEEATPAELPPAPPAIAD
ncbi:MAG: hypothetical protein R3F62_14900 [Planctomycetota bacterium]